MQHLTRTHRESYSALDPAQLTLLRLRNARTGITDIILTSARRMATTGPIGFPADSLSARVLGTADMDTTVAVTDEISMKIDTMDAGIDGITMTAGEITMAVVNSAATLDVEITGERVFGANAASVAKVASGAVNLTDAVSAAVNRGAEVSAAEMASEAANRAE